MTKVVKVNDMTIVMGNLSKQKNVALSVLIPVIFELLFHWSCLSWILTRKRKKKKILFHLTSFSVLVQGAQLPKVSWTRSLVSFH